MTSAGFTEHYFHAQDDLRLYYRDYGDRHSTRIPVLCLPGLTRNAKDFHDFATRQSIDRRVICFDFRGRGRSAYDPEPSNYQPSVYLSDLQHLLAVTHLHRAIVLGTSMGGLMAMAMSAAMPTALAGVILNDVGPDVSEAGRQRIAGSRANGGGRVARAASEARLGVVGAEGQAACHAMALDAQGGGLGSRWAARSGHVESSRVFVAV